MDEDKLCTMILAAAFRVVHLELKSIETLLPVHAKQVLTYIRLANLRLGYLPNFGEPRLKTGIKRLING
jgi:GxxExxY protein